MIVFFIEKKGREMYMKKILLLIISLLSFVSVGSFGIVNAATNDSTITYERIQGAYFYLQDKNTGKIDTNHVTKFFMNGEIAYCIEPMVDINGKIYNSTSDWNITNLSEDVIKYIERVGYFGYEYSGHNDDKYWLATQELIWNKVNSNVSVKFTTAPNGGGSLIDLSKEKNEILSLAENYDRVSSFAGQTIEGNIGDEISIVDENNVLTDFEISYDGKQSVTKSGNELKIKFNKITDNETVSFKKTKVNNQLSVIYYKDNSQKLASLKISYSPTFTLNLKGNGGTVEVNKKGEKIVYADGSYKYETISLPEVEFAIYANEDIVDGEGNIIYEKYDLVGTLTTDSLGFAKLENMYYGKYFLIEGKSAQGNMLDNKKYYFEITKNDIIEGNIIKKLDIQNYLPKGTLEFTKLDITNGNVIPNTEIMIFTEDDKLIFQGMTDEKGKVVITDLLAGQKYYIIERNPATGYQLSNEKVYFEIKANGEIVKAEMTNEQIEKVKVPDTQKDQSDFGNIVSLVVIVAAIGVLIYGEVRNKKNKSKKDKKEKK